MDSVREGYIGICILLPVQRGNSAHNRVGSCLHHSHGNHSLSTNKGKIIPLQTMKIQLQSSFNSAALVDKLARDGSVQKFVEPEP